VFDIIFIFESGYTVDHFSQKSKSKIGILKSRVLFKDHFDFGDSSEECITCGKSKYIPAGKWCFGRQAGVMAKHPA
tara:strand:+ start:376 stop:603 length:228 start_codon:yes stop_codon:yes gene_type:complete